MRKVAPMSRTTSYLRFVLLIAVLAMFAVFMGIDPWGPW
jgi:hypothetical protein